MKFSASVIALFAAASASAYSINNPNLVKRDDLDLSALGINSECLNDINQSNVISECIQEVNATNFKDICAVVNSEKCQSFYKDPFSIIPNCQNDVAISTMYSKELLAAYISTYESTCAFDENNNICPFSESIINKKDIDQSVIDATCKSKACTDKANTLLSNASAYGIDTSLVDYLKSAECTEKATSGASSLKMGSAIAASLGLLLYTLF